MRLRDAIPEACEAVPPVPELIEKGWRHSLRKPRSIARRSIKIRSSPQKSPLKMGLVVSGNAYHRTVSPYSMHIASGSPGVTRVVNTSSKPKQPQFLLKRARRPTERHQSAGQGPGRGCCSREACVTVRLARPDLRPCPAAPPRTLPRSIRLGGPRNHESSCRRTHGGSSGLATNIWRWGSG